MIDEDIKEYGVKERKSLMEKYDIPLYHLDFGYVKNLKNVKELEKIYKILISDEIGHYPELIKCTEEKLRELSPNNRLLRKSVPAISKDLLDKSEKNSYLKEISDWRDDMEAKETVLKKSTPSHIVQPVRRTSEKIGSDQPKTDKKNERINSFDYKSWDNYDADKECLRLELEEERKREEREKLERIERDKELARQKMSIEDAEIDAIKGLVCNMTPEEREVMSTREKEIGNEYYKTNRLDEAIKHYTRSVYLFPNVSNYNNRAATYLMQCKFSKALADLNVALKMDPDNVKARYRRAVAFQHKNEFQKALEDIRVVLAKEPNHVLARHFADRLREDCSDLPKKHSLKIKDEDGETHIEEVTEEEMLTNYKDKNFIEVNEFGLPKIMCNCNGKYMNEPGIRHEDNVRYQHIRQHTRRNEPGYAFQHSSAITPVPFHSATPPAIQSACNIPKAKPSLAGGGRRLDIVELDSINEEGEESTPTSCIVRDMRSTKDEKTNANINIAQSSPSRFTVTPASLNNDVKELDKSYKTAWNQTVKDSEGEEDDKDMGVEESVDWNNVAPSSSVDALEMMDTIDDSTVDIEPTEKPWTDQLLNSSVSSVNNDFEKCMDLNENENENMPNVNFGLGDASDSILHEIPSLDGCHCTLSLDSLKPQNFLEKWCRSNQEPSAEASLRSKANLLKGVCPMHVTEVFSLNVNESILADIINCLCHFYHENFDREIILGYARAVTNLQRFNINICFVDDEAKKKLKDVFIRMGLSPYDLLLKAFKI